MKRKAPKYIKQSRPELTAQEVKFCQYISESMSGIDALKKAGYKFSSEASYYTSANRLLRIDKIRKYLAELREQASKTAKINFNKVVEQWSYIAFGDRRAIYNQDGTLKPPHEWPHEIQVSVASAETIETENGVVKKIRFEPRGEALKELARLIGYGEPETRGRPKTAPSEDKTIYKDIANDEATAELGGD